MGTANSNKAVAKKSFKTELAALEALKERGVTYLASEYAYNKNTPISIEAVILDARSSVRGSNPLRLTTWHTTGVAKLVLSDAAESLTYIETGKRQ
ncbi:MAG: hypothetical protein IPK60_21195 [Sandaracinaceae bacterium]|nr:hypothetical protein [Sandaracinaceae bacterium]